MSARCRLFFLIVFSSGLGLSACTTQSDGTSLAQACINGSICPIGYECVSGYCLPSGGETLGGDADAGDGDGDTGDGDGDGDTGDGDGDTGDGDGDTGDGDGDTGDGDGDSGDGDGDCQPGTLGCTCDGGVCALGLYCDGDYICSEPVCGDGLVSADEECDGDDLEGLDCQDLGFDWGELACDGVTCMYDTSACGNGAACGNGVIEDGEQCDGNNLGGFSCLDLGFTGGQLTCDPFTCTFDASECFV